ncbi:hypothetical protein AXF42_Ash021599 [Apostasia shenzhenica]|uniref:Uncharacterized protein n=1 Tax=Apostasia shenzhenica TaxID=1088818 RepID=A0A2H9ZYM4_9ASPA|nr:hypothetical protein AXF42_Ash021599 [Apostasia shenzhenica]
MFSGASSSYFDWSDYYFFVGGDLGIPLTPRVCPPEFTGDVKWVIRQDTLRNLERLKGQSWLLQDFLRYVKNDTCQGAGVQRLERSRPPFWRSYDEEGQEGAPCHPTQQRGCCGRGREEIRVLESVCGKAIVDVVSSPEDTTDDKKTLAELDYTRKGKDPMPATKPQAIPKSGTGVVIGGKNEGNKADGGQEKEKVERPCLELVPREVHGEKRGSSGNTKPEPPQKKARSVEERGFAAGEEHDWQRSVEPPYSANLVRIFGDVGTRLAMRTTGDDRRMTVLTVPSENKGQVYRGEVGLALGSGLVAKDLEEKMEATSTPDLYSGLANRIAMVRIPFSGFPICFNPVG